MYTHYLGREQEQGAEHQTDNVDNNAIAEGWRRDPPSDFVLKWLDDVHREIQNELSGNDSSADWFAEVHRDNAKSSIHLSMLPEKKGIVRSVSDP